MYCNYCGKVVPDDANLCPYCGTRIGNVAARKKLMRLARAGRLPAYALDLPSTSTWT